MTKYLKSHEWVKLEGKIATVGITDHAQSELSDVVFVDLPEVGKSVQKEKSFMAVESVKAASDIYAPMSGKVVEVNDSLRENPEKVNQAAETEGWLVKIEVSNPGEFDGLLTESEYKASSGH